MTYTIYTTHDQLGGRYIGGDLPYCRGRDGKPVQYKSSLACHIDLKRLRRRGAYAVDEHGTRYVEGPGDQREQGRSRRGTPGG